MNTLMLVALAVVALCYCGGKYCPSVLKQNKEVVLGVLVGMALSSFAGLKLEGIVEGPGTVSKEIQEEMSESTAMQYEACVQTAREKFLEGRLGVSDYVTGVQNCYVRDSPSDP